MKEPEYDTDPEGAHKILREKTETFPESEKRYTEPGEAFLTVQNNWYSTNTGTGERRIQKNNPVF
jgi:hypothetical protein